VNAINQDAARGLCPGMADPKIRKGMETYQRRNARQVIQHEIIKLIPQEKLGLQLHCPHLGKKSHEQMALTLPKFVPKTCSHM
jgi:hypothetical protein